MDDVAAASGSNELKKENLSSRLNKIIQLTGFSDPIYAEAFVKVHQYDVVLDVLLVNQTTTTLRNLSVEFATLGDLKVVDKPTTANIDLMVSTKFKQLLKLLRLILVSSLVT